MTGILLALSVLAPCSLLVERQANPVGVDNPTPRFSWQVPAHASATGVVQTAYRLQVASTADGLASGKADLWDSGKVAEDTTLDVPYAGRPLATSQRAFALLTTWDSSGRCLRQGPVEWTMGVLAARDWQARWIGGNPATFDEPDTRGGQWIRSRGTNGCSRTFHVGTVPRTPVEMSFSATSEYRIYINGALWKKSEMLDDFARRLRTYNLTPRLRKGANTITVRPLVKGERVTLAPDSNLTFFVAAQLPDGQRLVSDGTWSDVAACLGGLREPKFAQGMRTAIERVAPAFRKTFVAEREVREAVLHITAPGYYEASLNGKRIGRKVLDPSPTDFTKRVLYSTYRLDDAIRPGSNTLEVLLGHGTYDVRSQAYWNYDCARWTGSPCLIAQLEITYANGSRHVIGTDGSWRHIVNPVSYDCIREGEVIGRDEARGGQTWENLPAACVTGPKGRLVAAGIRGAEITAEIRPREIRATSDGHLIAFPVNFTGWMRLRVRGAQAGDVITVRYDEKLETDGTPCKYRRLDALRTSLSYRVTGQDNGIQQQDRYYARGEDTETYEPRFTYNGFQYVWVKGLRQTPAAEDVVGCEIRTAFPKIGTFECSSETFNRLIEMADRSYRSNFTDGHPTDCPQREKLGWLGDAGIGAHYGLTAYQTAPEYAKWLRDIVDCQRADGAIPVMAPTGGWGFQWGTGPTWENTLTAVAELLWSRQGLGDGDTTVYPAFTSYAAYVDARANGGLITWGLTDWLSNGPYPTVPFLASCHYVNMLRHAAETGKRLGDRSGSARYAAQADRLHALIRQRYRHADGTWDNGSQTAQAVALAFNIATADERAATGKKLIEAVQRANNTIAFGLFGSRYVFPALSEIGRTDLAFEMITKTNSFSFATYLAQGLTTLPERWDAENSGSLNHAMHCDYATWAIEYLGGVREPTDGYRTFLVAPEPIAALDWARTELNTPRGKITSTWRRASGRVDYAIVVPPNTRARIRLPGENERTYGSGKHVFTR